MIGIQPPEDLQLQRRPIIVAGRCPLLPGIGNDINGTLDRINGYPLQAFHRSAYAKNIDFIANKENATVVIPPSPNDSDPINKLFGGIFSDEPDISSQKNPDIHLEVGDNQQVAFYPQDCFLQLNGTVVAKDTNAENYFHPLFPTGSEVIIHPDIGEGGKSVRGQTIFFYSSKEPLPQQLEEKIRASTHRILIRLPPPQEVGIDDVNRAIKMDHIDQMIGPDVIVADKNGKYVLIPITEDYFQSLNDKGVLPKEVKQEPHQESMTYPAASCEVSG